MDETVLNREQIERELETVRGLSADGKLYPEQAVAWARNNRESAIYSHLEWDDTKAAEAFRVDQVRGLIRIVVTTSSETGRSVRAYISQPSDRTHGGGYSRIDQSLMRARQELVNEALTKIRRFRNQFTHLPELDPLFAEIDQRVNTFVETRLTRAAG